VNTAEDNIEMIREQEARKSPLMGWIVKFILLGGAWWLVYRSLQPLADWLTYALFGLSRSGHMGSAVAFFLFEAPKVLMLLLISPPSGPGRSWPASASPWATSWQPCWVS
jgi:hypothetical protein